MKELLKIIEQKNCVYYNYIEDNKEYCELKFVAKAPELKMSGAER